MSPMASYIGLLKSRFDGSVAAASAATAVDIEEAAVAVEDDTLPKWNSVGGRTWEDHKFTTMCQNMTRRITN